METEEGVTVFLDSNILFSISCLTVPDADLALDLKLPEKDGLLLSAAIAARASFFLTGNTADFKALYGRSIKGTRVLTPRAFLGKEY